MCDRPLERLPDATSTGVADATTAVDRAQQQVDAATRTHRDATTAHTRATTERDGLATRLQTCDAAIADATETGVPATPEALRGRLEAIGALDEQLAAARRTEQQARAADRSARAELERVQAAEQQAWRAFDALWQQVAELAPPAVDRGDLAGAWTTLATWAAERRPALLAEADAAKREVDATADRWKAEVARLREACHAHDVLVRDGEQPRDAARREVERARHQHETLARRLAESEQVRRDLAEARRQQRLAHQLGLHLKSSNFEKWLLNRALRRLVVGATRMLRELSDGAYSLTLDDGGGFAVVDHRNADETRSARTLSGGETFLASLALALALSEHVADLAAQGAARLESLILDEGFGTLDTETLDVVASALEELGSRGRQVGVITHVGALAQRLPVRYDVRKEAGTSTVTRADT